jgi:O-antigen ligase
MMQVIRNNRKFEALDRVIEWGIYLFMIFMFLSKGESIRNILIFGNFTLWLLTLKYRKNLYILNEPVSMLFWVFSGFTIFSVLFSIDPLYSFLSLRNDPLKPVLLFPVIATVMADTNRLRRAAYVSFLTVVVIVIIGYYSYLFHDIPVLRPDTAIMHTGHTGHSRFARYLNTLLPFMLILYSVRDKKHLLKTLLTITFVISIFALVLSTSREGYIAFVSMTFILAAYLSRKRGYNFYKLISGIIMIILLLGALSWFSFPNVRERMSRTFEELPTMNLRTEVWKPALYAIKESPVFGWGHGDRIFRQSEPYKNTPYKDILPVTSEGSPRRPHNTFLKILFHRGITGFIPYLLLIIFSLRVFWKGACEASGIKSYVLLACAAVVIGNYIINSLLADLELRYMAVVLGLGMAARGIDENSDN